MSDVIVTVIDNTPQVTITNNETLAVSVIQANPISLVPIDAQPKVIINTGIGGVYDTSTLLAMFKGILSLDELTPSLKADLLQLQSLWARIGTQVNLLTASDEVSIRQAAIDYTNENITLTVAAIDADTDGKISSAVSVVDQKADSIKLQIDSFEQDTEDNFIAYNTQLTANTDSIAASVMRLDAIDGPGGDVVLLGSRIGITESAIEQEVIARQLTDGNLIETNTNLNLAVDTINAAVTTFNEVEDRVTATEMILGEDGIVLSTMAQQFNFTISTIQTMLNNQWGVTIAESAGGSKYATGFKAILHPLWVLGAAYVVDDTMFYDDLVYICIADHTASLINNPAGIDGATYWAEIVGGEKTEFSVQADKFYVQVAGSETPIPVFTVTEGVVSINGDLIISGKIQSTNYVATNNTSGATPTGFKIDSVNEIFDMSGLTYTPSTGLVITGTSGLNYTSQPSPPYKVGQLWQDGTVVKRCITAKTTGQAYDAADWTVSSTDDTSFRHSSDVTKIDGGKIFTGTVVANSIAANAITAAKVGTNEIVASSANIANAVVIESKIANGAITNAKIGSAAVQAANIQNASITNLKVATLSYLNGTKIGVSGTGTWSVDLNNYQDFTVSHGLGRYAILRLIHNSGIFNPVTQIVLLSESTSAFSYRIFGTEYQGASVTYVYL